MTMYYRRRQRRRRWQSYIFPLMVLLAVLLAFVIVFKGISFLLNLGDDEARVTLYVEQGQVDVLPLGQPDALAQVVKGQPLFVGDTVKTGQLTRAVLVFADSTQLRLAPNTEVEITDVVATDDEEGLHVKLNSGEVWVNANTSDPLKDYDYVVSTANLDVRAIGTIFDVKSRLPEYVRVFNGIVNVDVKSNDEIVDEKVPVGVAQQLSLTAEALDAFVNRSATDVLDGIDSSFELSDWYEWNMNLDANLNLVLSFDGNSPVAGIGFNDGTELDEDDLDETNEEDSEDEEEEELDPDAPQDDSELPAPKVTSPKTGATVSEGVLQIVGTTDADTMKIEVTSYENGEDSPNPYVLQRYEAGSKNWVYVATYDGGNLVEGENVFEIRAIDAEGNKSEPTVVKFTFEKPVEAGVDVKPLEVETEPVDLPKSVDLGDLEI